MGWKVEFSKPANDDLMALDRPIRRRIIDAIEWFSENFDDITPLPLGGPWKGFFKLRVGDWRVIYEMKPRTKFLIVRYIDKRDRVYRKA